MDCQLKALFPTKRIDDARTQEFMLDEFRTLAKRAFATQGARAFENTERATAVHEAGHVVIAILDGRTVERVRIKRKRVGDVKAWTGYTSDGLHHEASLSSPVEADVKVARSEISGMLAEAMFDGRDFRHGSSLDEVVGFKVFVTNISAKTGTPFENVALRILAGVVADLGQHRPEVEAIAAALMARGELKTNALNKVITGVRRKKK